MNIEALLQAADQAAYGHTAGLIHWSEKNI
jgi:hypothetical protein